MKSAIVSCALLLTAACNAIPKDPEGTLERVRAERRFKVGLIASGHEPVDPDRRSAFLTGIARAAGARPSIEVGATEPLLAKLEGGALDLVIGAFEPKSPWAKG